MEATQQKIEYTYTTAKRLLKKSEVLQPHQEIVGALLMMGLIPEPLPTEVSEIRDTLVQEGFM
jgi:hypothetical protein